MSITWVLCRGEDVEGANSQFANEFRFIMNLGRRFTFYSLNHPGVVISNWTQVMNLSDKEEMKRLVAVEESFRQFGPDAGFDHSIAEKYVLLPRGIEATDGVGGELVLLSAQPFNNRNGEPVRAFIAQITNQFRGAIMPERKVQRIMTAVGQTIPKPEPSVPLPRPSPEELRARHQAERDRYTLLNQIAQADIRERRRLSSVPLTGDQSSETQPRSNSDAVSRNELIPTAISPPSFWPFVGLGVLILVTLFVWWHKRP